MRSLNTATAIVAALGICGVAAAQSKSDMSPTGITVRGGVALPVDKSLTNVASALANLGVEFNLNSSLMSTGETFFSLDYFFKGFGGNGTGSAMPVMINQRFYGSANENRSYYFVGVGAAFMSVNGNGTAIAARGGVGQELGKSLIAEITGYLSDRAAGVRANAVTFNIGYRF